MPTIREMTLNIQHSIEQNKYFSDVVYDIDSLVYILDALSSKQKHLSKREVRYIYNLGMYLSSDSTLNYGQYARGFYLWHSVKLLEIAAKSKNAPKDILKQLSVYNSASISEAAKRHPNNPYGSFV